MARVVMFVLNDCRTDARVLREAGTLAAAGHSVTVVARTTDPYAAAGEVDQQEGFTIVRVPVATGLTRLLLLGRRPARLVRALAGSGCRQVREGPRGWRTLIAGAAGLVIAAPLAAAGAVVVGLPLLALARIPAARPAWLDLEWRLQWRFGVIPWTGGAVRAAPPGDVFHAHDLRALPAAIAARARVGGAVVYDSHEIFVEAGANARRPARSRAALRRVERSLAAEAEALVTVNDDLAAVLGPALGLDGRVVVVRNCPPRWDPPEDDPGLLRAAAGVPAHVPLLLCHGSFLPHRGFEQVAAALALPALQGAHAIFLGLGPLRPLLLGLAADPAVRGRLHVVDAVPPAVLPQWISGADIDVVAIQPTTLNHRLSTPNKLFESLAAGVPVVASDFGPMRDIVLGDVDGPLGVVCDPSDPAALADAARSLLDLPAADFTALRRRCLAAAHARYAWEIDRTRLLALYERLTSPLAGTEPPGSAPDSPGPGPSTHPVADR